MNNYDELKATTKKDEDTVVSIHVPKAPEINKKKKKITIFSLFMTALKSDNFKRRERNENAPFSLPVPKYTILAFMIVFFILLVFILMQSFIDYLILLPLFIVFFSVAMPSIIMVFFVEFNTRRSIYPLHILIMFIMGIFSYAFVSYICDKLFISLVFDIYVNTIIRPILWIVILFALVFICTTVLKVSRLPECLLIAVSFALGYSVSYSLLTAFNCLFIDYETTIQGVPYILKVIINEPQDLKTSLEQSMSVWLNAYIYTPVLFTSLSVIIGSVVSYKQQSKSQNRPMVKSLYLLLMLDVILYSISVAETSFLLFDVILRIVAILSAMTVSIKILEYCLVKEGV